MSKFWTAVAMIALSALGLALMIGTSPVPLPPPGK
jgi:hypothetical protein